MQHGDIMLTMQAAGPDQPKGLQELCNRAVWHPAVHIPNLQKVHVFWKTNFLVPMHKKTRPTAISDNNPVALTSHVMKSLKRQELWTPKLDSILSNLVLSHLVSLCLISSYILCLWARWYISSVLLLVGSSNASFNLLVPCLEPEPAHRATVYGWNGLPSRPSDCLECRERFQTIVHNALGPQQFAYQPHMGVEDGIIFRLYRAYAYLDDSHSNVRVMLFDFSCGFKTIKPALLGDKLKEMQVDELMVPWIMNYLTIRLLHVRLQNCRSDSTVCDLGAPQGDSAFIFNDHAPHLTSATVCRCLHDCGICTGVSWAALLSEETLVIQNLFQDSADVLPLSIFYAVVC